MFVMSMVINDSSIGFFDSYNDGDVDDLFKVVRLFRTNRTAHGQIQRRIERQIDAYKTDRIDQINRSKRSKRLAIEFFEGHSA